MIFHQKINRRVLNLIRRLELAACIVIFLHLPSIAQIHIGTNAKVKISGLFSINSNINNTATADFSEAQLNLVGSTQEIKTNQDLKVSTLRIAEAGIKTFLGNWEITESIDLVDGILKVDNASQLLYSGSVLVEGRNISYVEGVFYVVGAGEKNFPVGADGNYLPTFIEGLSNPSIPLGVQVVGASSNFSSPAPVRALLQSHYWQFTSAPNVVVALSLNVTSDFLKAQQPVILEAETTGVRAFYVPSTATMDFVTSTRPVTKSFLAIGREFSLVIHDMITPYTLDEINDRLFIEKIELTEKNKVVLLDRWGKIILELQNFTNDTSYDFSTLSPGNYVCIVDYVPPGENTNSIQRGIVSILNSK